MDVFESGVPPSYLTPPVPLHSQLQVDELMDVFECGGAAAVEGYALQGLTWEQVKELKGPNLVGLGMGSGPAPGDFNAIAVAAALHTLGFRIKA